MLDDSPGTRFFDAKDLSKTQTWLPPMEAPNAGRVG